MWLSNLFDELNLEYFYRYGSRHNPQRWHSASRMIDALGQSPLRIPQGAFTEPPQCMPDVFKDDCTVTAYRKYYQYAKAGFNKWTRRMEPHWVSEKIPL